MSRPEDSIHAPAHFAAKANMRHRDYVHEYAESERDPDAFWGRIAERLDWMRKPEVVRNVSYDLADFRIRWYEDGELNASVNCLDRHLRDRGDKTAIVFEPDDPATPARSLTYRELYQQTCRLANAMRSRASQPPDAPSAIRITAAAARTARPRHAPSRSGRLRKRAALSAGGIGSSSAGSSAARRR